MFMNCGSQLMNVEWDGHHDAVELQTLQRPS
jgi:hypothetical protein